MRTIYIFEHILQQINAPFWTYLGRPRNVGRRNKRGAFSIRRDCSRARIWLKGDLSKGKVKVVRHDNRMFTCLSKILTWGGDNQNVNPFMHRLLDRMWSWVIFFLTWEPHSGIPLFWPSNAFIQFKFIYDTINVRWRHILMESVVRSTSFLCSWINQLY